MYGEVSWDHIDRLIEAYAASCLFVDARDLETRLSRAIADLQRYPATFDDLTALLSTRSPSREMISRRIAWTAQHLFACRAWTVGTKLLTKLPRDQYASPLLDQLRTLGLTTRLRPGAVATTPVGASSAATGTQSPDTPDATNTSPDTDVAELEVIDASPFTGRLAFSNIDAMLATPASDEVWVVKGCSYTQAARTSPDLWINADRTSLFGNNDRFLTNLFAPGAHVRTLLAARDLVQISHPGLRVRAAYLVANDPGCSWHFQCHDLTAARPAVARQPKLHLDAYPIHATYRDFPAHFAREALGFAPMPDFASGGGPRSSGGLHRESATTPHGTTTSHAPSADALSALPADRPTRALLLLQDLWTRQLNRPKRLASARADDLAASVTRNAAIFMPKDQYRHDLEDCLERAHLVRRLPDHPGRFAITPKGVGRLLLLRQKLGRAPDLTTPQLLSHITHQARLWAAAPVA
jgi:hypothetical protein